MLPEWLTLFHKNLVKKKMNKNSESWVKLIKTKICLLCPSKAKMEGNASIQHRGCCALGVLEGTEKLSAGIKSLLGVLSSRVLLQLSNAQLWSNFSSQTLCFDADSELESF